MFINLNKPCVYKYGDIYAHKGIFTWLIGLKAVEPYSYFVSSCPLKDVWQRSHSNKPWIITVQEKETFLYNYNDDMIMLSLYSSTPSP